MGRQRAVQIVQLFSARRINGECHTEIVACATVPHLDGAGVESVNRSIEFQSKWFFGIQGACHANQVLGEVGVDLPRACGVRIGQRVAKSSGSETPCGTAVWLGRAS